MEEINPYAAPQAKILLDDTHAVHMRRTFLRTERHLKAFGLLVMMLSLVAIIAKVMRARVLSEEFGMMIIPWPQIMISSLMGVIGVGLYLVKRWAGLLAMVLGFLMILISISQLPSGLITIAFQTGALVFLGSVRVRCVLSPDYQSVILRTPMIKSPPAKWIVPVVVVIVLLMLVPAVLFGMR